MSEVENLREAQKASAPPGLFNARIAIFEGNSSNSAILLFGETFKEPLAHYCQLLFDHVVFSKHANRSISGSVALIRCSGVEQFRCISQIHESQGRLEEVRCKTFSS